MPFYAPPPAPHYAPASTPMQIVGAPAPSWDPGGQLLQPITQPQPITPSTTGLLPPRTAPPNVGLLPPRRAPIDGPRWWRRYLPFFRREA